MITAGHSNWSTCTYFRLLMELHIDLPIVTWLSCALFTDSFR